MAASSAPHADPATPGTSPDAPGARRRPTAALVAGGVALAAAALYGVGYAATGNTLPAGTTIQGVGVGGLTRDGALATLQRELGRTTSASVTLVAGETRIGRPPAQLGLGFDYEASLNVPGGRKSWNPADILAALAPGGDHLAVVTRDEAKLRQALDQLAARDHAAQNARVRFDGTTPRVQAGKNGEALDRDAALRTIEARWPASTTIEVPVTTTEPDITTAEAQHAVDTVAKPAVADPITLRASGKTIKLGPDTIAAALRFEPSGQGGLKAVVDPKALASATSERLQELGAKAPKDATIRLSAQGTPEVVPSVDGYGVTPEALAQAVAGVLTADAPRTADIALSFSAVPADLTTAEAEALGVKEVTGEFTTKFTGQFPYRYVNIPKAAGLINNTFLKPGESFSLNETLGERTLDAGWAAGFGIDGGSEVVVPGGGVSQLTTTLYNAVFYAGLEDIEHKPHSLYFARYPKGREATLSWPDLDLKFRNDSPYGVLIQSSTTGKPGVQGTVTVKIWSTKRYDVKQANTVVTNRKQVTDLDATPDDSPDCVAQEAVNGFDVHFDRQFWADGKLVKSVPYFWHYNTLLPTVCTNPAALAANEQRKVDDGTSGD